MTIRPLLFPLSFLGFRFGGGTTSVSDGGGVFGAYGVTFFELFSSFPATFERFSARFALAFSKAAIWAAVTNSLSMTALAFFMVIFFWTPPHFWALAIKYKEDYSAAGIPMLPVVATKARVHKEMWFHTIMMIACSIWLIISAGLPLWSMVVTVLLGLVFARELIALKEGSENYVKTAAKIFQWSITYLSLLSVVLVAAQLSV